MFQVSVWPAPSEDESIFAQRNWTLTGAPVPLSRYFKAGRPVVLALVYYDCPMMCTMVLRGMLSAFKVMSFDVGKEFEVVTVSFDVRETPKLAGEKKATYLAEYARSGNRELRRESGAAGWHFLTGDKAAIDQLTRPVDAIKHQAKTVTVGISRADEELLTVPLVRALLEAGASRDRFGYRDLRALAALDPAVQKVLGSTRYRIDGEISAAAAATIQVIDQRGTAQRLKSRTSANPTLKGTKHLVAMERQAMVAKGRSDGRTVGWVTSGGYAHWSGKSVALGYIEAGAGALTIEILGEHRPAVITPEPLFDPTGTRMRI